MAIIRKLSHFDKSKLKSMISFLGNDEAEELVKRLINSSCDWFHYWLPLRLKFQAESYVLLDGSGIHGMISILPSRGNPYKIKIIKLLFEKNYYNIAKQLIEFVIARYGAKGAQTFEVSIDESHDELMKLFVDGCGFRQCSCEQLWRMNEFDFSPEIDGNIRRFKNSDKKEVASLFNDSLITHFKPSLLKSKSEYSEPLFNGLTDNYNFQYVIEDSNSRNIIAYFSIKTYDNSNYVIDISASNGYDFDYSKILAFAKQEIKKRHKKSSIFVKLKKYVNNAENFEKFLNENHFNCIQTQMILVKDFYKLVKQEQKVMEVVFFNESKPVFKVINKKESR